MVYLVYSSNLKFDGVYENESDAYMRCISKNIDSEKLQWSVIDLTYYKKELTTLDYSEEDSEMDESYYLDKIKELNNKIYELTDSIDIEKVQYRNLEAFTSSFILTLFTFTLLAGCVYLFTV